jgi:hypothetical protein
VLHSGEAVVVKVQRPGLKQLFDIDLNNLRILAEQLDKGDDNRDFKVGGFPFGGRGIRIQGGGGRVEGWNTPRLEREC